MGDVLAELHRFDVLGPLAVRVGGRVVRLGGPRQRSVLALLLLNVCQVVPTDRIVDELWEGSPPPAAETTVRSYVWHLRKALHHPAFPSPTGPIATRPSGYLLDIDPQQVDATRFGRLLADGRAQLRQGDAATAARLLRSALGLWRGPALADLAAQPWARAHCAQLEESRQSAIEARVEADLALGRHEELVGELGMLVAEHPLRERLHAQRMLALYRCERQAEALDAYRVAYELLTAGHGIDLCSTLRDLEAAILRQDPELDWSPTADRRGPRPAELSADISSFTGRAGPLAELDALLGANSGAVVISAIAGTGGIGKTALAVHWGHRVRDRFPDGQLQINLRGYAPGPPVRPIDALARFLRALGLPAEQVPVDEDEAASRYRSLLADRRVLVLLDNAASAEQVRPLLPASPGSLVVVTSRDRLAGLTARDGATRLALDVLTTDEALALLTRVVGEARIRAEPDAAVELVRLCANLPLALQIAAANLVHQPWRGIRDHVAELRDGDRLAALEVDDDDQSAVRNTFDLSYTTLPEHDRRLFRLLGLTPGADVTAEAAAALADVPLADARRSLDRLTGAHVIDALPADRYGFHDLLRLYAAEHARAEDSVAERRAALDRLFDHYRAGTQAATDAAFPAEKRRARGRAAPAPPLTAAQGRQWLDAERVNLVALTDHAARHGWPQHACDLAAMLWPYHVNGPHLSDAITVNTHALRAARDRGDRDAEADALTNLGAACWKSGRPSAAQEHLERAMAIRRRIGDRSGTGWTLNHLASVHWSCGRYRQFFDHAEQALATFRDLGDRNGEVIVLVNLGEVYGRVGRYQHGVDLLGEAAAIANETGHTSGESGAVEALSLVHWWWGRLPEAFDHARRAVAIARRIGDRADESAARTILGLVHARWGQAAEAVRQAELALDIAREIGVPRRQVVALNSFAEVLRIVGRPTEGVERHRAALALARETNDRDEQARALDGAAHVLHTTGDPDLARRYWQEALAIYTDLEVPEAHEVGAHLLRR